MCRWPFECTGSDGRIYFHFDAWRAFLSQKQAEYPPTPYNRRFEITLVYPRLRLEEVFTPIGPVSHHDIQYHSNDWSLIFDVYPAHCFTADGDNSIKILIEEGHINPWGEPVTVMSEHPENAFDNNFRNFVYFRQQYWKILSAVDLTNPVYYSETIPSRLTTPILPSDIQSQSLMFPSHIFNVGLPTWGRN